MNPWKFFRVGSEIIRSNPLRFSSRLKKPEAQPSYHNKSAKYHSDDLIDVDYTFVSSNRPNIYNYSGREYDFGSQVPVRSQPGYPSSDFVRYFARYTSLGGRPKAAPAAYRASRLIFAPYEYYPEPENSHSQFERLIDTKEKKDPLNSYKNFLFAEDNFISRADTDRLVSPNGQGSFIKVQCQEEESC